jgi:putative transposase
MERRLQLVREYLSGLYSMTELAAQYGVSRKTGYKWTALYVASEYVVGAVADRSRRPHTCPTATDPAVLEALLTLRRRFPRRGPKKLLKMLATAQPTWVLPRRTTVSDHLKAAGLIQGRPRRPGRVRLPAMLAPITGPNTTWTTDFKGQFRTRDGRYCYPLTLRDGWSRFVLRCEGLRAMTVAETQRQFARAFAEYGLPDRMRSDNGLPFVSTGLAGLSRLAVWWLRLGIIPERIAPGRPDQNGAHEQFHAVLKAETTRPPAANLRAQQQRFDLFRRDYNDARPHEALNQETPASRYVPSRRAFPATLPRLEYPGHMEVRRVSSSGCIAWCNAQPFVSETLSGEWVALEEVADGIWTLYFASVALARFDERQGCFHPIAKFKAGAHADTSARACHPKSKTRKPQ